MGGENRLCVCVIRWRKGVCYLQKKPPVSSTRVRGEWEKSGHQFIINEHGKRGKCVFLWCFINYSVCPFLLLAFFLSLTDCCKCRAPLNNVLV